MRRYRFVGRYNQFGGHYKIPHGSVVKLLYWGKKRHVLVEYNGEKIRTMGTLLRRLDKT